MSLREYYTYMVRCRDDSLYTGFTTDLAARVATHNEGRGAKYTRSRRPVRLVWSHAFATEREARRCEYRLKRLPRRRKLVLVAGREADAAAYEKVWADVMQAEEVQAEC